MQATLEPDNKTPEEPRENPGEQGYQQLIQHENPARPTKSTQTANNQPTDDLYNPQAQPDNAAAQEQADLQNQTGQATAPAHENQVGKGYKKTSNIKKTFWVFSNRRAIFGGGAIGALIAALIFFIGGGPLQFIHIAHLLEQWHFSSQQDQQDNRFTKEVRFIKYASSGEVEKTRLGYLGNKLADTFEAGLNKSGFQSSYSPKFGLFDGWVVDTESKDSPFHGMNDQEATQAVKEATGLDVVDGGNVRSNLKGKLVISAKGLGYFKTKALTTNLLTNAKYNKIPASVGARIMCKRASCTLHPLRQLTSSAKSAVEDWWGKRNAIDEEGQTAAEAKGNSTQDPKATANEKAGQDTGANSINDTSSQAQAAKQDPSKFAQFKQSTSAKLLGGGAAAIGVLCMVKGVNDHYGEVKQTQVILPLTRMGTEMMGVGNQLESGQDISSSELSKYSAQLNGKDSNGQYSSWSQANSIQAEEGHTPSGTVGKPDGTLSSIGQGAPFGFVNTAPLGSILGVACSTVGSIFTAGASIALDFTGIGAAVGNLTGQAVGAIFSGQIIDQIAHWLAGSAVDVNAVGASFGNDFNYGAKLAANDQALSSGGRALSSQESTQLADFENSQVQQQFQKKSIAYKLFNPYDEKSVISKVIDNTSPNPGQDFAKMGSMFLNFGHIFAAIPRIFTANAHAAGLPYDYGFPTFGFSQAEMDDPTLENPYKNACYVFGCNGVLDDNGNTVNIPGFITDANGNVTPTGQSYIDKAKACFGINIAKDSQGQWDVTDSGDAPPNPYDSDHYDTSGCATGNGLAFSPGNNSQISAEPKILTAASTTTTNPNWLRLRMLSTDTVVMNSMSCFAGDNSDSNVQEACSDVDSNSTSTSTSTQTDTTTSTAGSTIDMANLYKDSTGVACAAGTTDIGVYDGYTNNQKVSVRLCAIPGTSSSSEESNGGYGMKNANGQVVVNSRVSGAILALVQAAASAGIKPAAADSSFRTMAHQTCLYTGACPAGGSVAAPGTSNHQMGLAVDWSPTMYNWLASGNGAKFGFKALVVGEPWHWSPTGN